MSALADREQRMEALQRANDRRSQRAGMRRRFMAEGRAGGATAARVLLRNPEVIRSMDIGEFLLWVRFLDKTKVRGLLERHRISPWCPVDELPERARRELADGLVRFANGGAL